MTMWTSDQLNKFGRAEELQIASLRRDGTLRKPPPIWVIRVGDDLYVRSMNGPPAMTHTAVQEQLDGKAADCYYRILPKRIYFQH